MDILKELKSRVVGQDEALGKIAPYIDIYKAGLSPIDRPAGIFLLAGLTGTGKSLTAEAIADVLHGNSKAVVTINCAEYHSDHEVAKLIGAPPGYVGHKETKAALSEEKLKEVRSKNCKLSIILFDEIEKTSTAFHRFVLGILDKGVLNLADGNKVLFADTLILMTSNLGAKQLRQASEGMGFSNHKVISNATINTITKSAVKGFFSPEFMNRLDSVITYHRLTKEDCKVIINMQLDALNYHLVSRLGDLSFSVSFTNLVVDYILDKGMSTDFGAREIKRIIQFELLHMLSVGYLNNKILPEDQIKIFIDSSDKLSYQKIKKK